MGNSESTLKTSAMHDQHAAAALAEAKRTNDLLANIMLLTAGTALLTAFLMLRKHPAALTDQTG
ncbi:hypothetical protein Tdes44962_MAKER08970 [Teratosphaeria destructans]|uniref:Uncharacterized protein n=1 Tax=Teratosphaeria destructans TaxID=418781 RepID=A0A9W7SUL1_9PEZI|nr:hypothetical protein Tdes44962_MAKER08970 [Teratosphaeria destructans]